MKRLLLSLGCLVAFCAVASAQSDSGGGGGGNLSIGSFDPNNATAPAASVEGAGIKVGEGTVVHPVVGFSTGAVSNVFYEETGTNAAGVLRLLVQVAVGSLSAARMSQTSAGTNTEVDSGDFQYRASLRLAYDFILSGNDTATATGGLGAGATLRGVVNPRGKLSLGFEDNFTRYIRAANFETDADTNRDINQFGLNLLFHPQGRSVSGYLYYNNTIDVFEADAQSFADRIQHRVGLHPMWRWLPKTSLFGDVSLGFYGGLGGDSMKVSSMPFTAIAGISTLLSVKTSLIFNAGYTNGFYATGPSYSGVTGGVQLAYRYSPLGRAAVTYDLKYEDSVNANYYRDHIFRVAVQQMFVPFALMVQPEVHLREYNGITAVMGPPVRNDVILSVVAGAVYNLRNELSVGLDYRLSIVESDYLYMVDAVTADDPSFVRHQLMLGLRWAL